MVFIEIEECGIQSFAADIKLPQFYGILAYLVISVKFGKGSERHIPPSS